MTAAELKHPPQPDQDLVAGRYRITERIGQGRLGDIFRAIDEKHQRVGVEEHLALQMVSDVIGSSNSLFNKLRVGYQALQAAGHPNIVKYRSLDRDGGNAYLVMEQLDGAPLSELLEDAERLPLDEVRPVLRGIGDALQFLHAERLVHGNLTARNVFITNELDAQLLDVVPLGGADAIFQGDTASSSTGRTTVANDVFGLACLTYQMLAGKHPFNHSRAGLAGREPDRIAGLDDHEWNVLRLALTLDGDQRSYTVADFQRDFGVRGNEHLRSLAASPVAEKQVPRPRSVADLPSAIPRDSASFEDRHTQFPDRWPEMEKDEARTSPWRAMVLGVLLVGLGAWAFFGQPEERIVDLIAYVDSRTDIGTTEQVGVAVAQPEVEKPEVEQPEVEQLEMLQPLPEDDVVAVNPEPSAEPETLETELVGPPAEAETVETELVGPPAVPTSEPVAEPVAEESAATEPEVGFTESVVAVSERDALAQVWLRRDVASNLPLVWWTSEHSARGGSDYVSGV